MAYLVLENGIYFTGDKIGSNKETIFEVVFNTSMVGYVETITDPSYFGQGVVFSYPLIGNYGFMSKDAESGKVWISALICQELCKTPSNFRCEETLNECLIKNSIPGLENVNTRELIKVLRKSGVQKGMIVDSIDNLAEIITKIKNYNTPNAMDYVCVKEPVIKGTGSLKIALYDFGVKGNIVDSLVTRNCKVCIYPANYSYEQMQDFLPDGYVISNGPCNPEDNVFSIQQIKKMYDSNTPILGICLGHQMMGLAVGFKTAKLKYGHRGPNHPCKFVPNGINYITSQNHGYYIIEESINPAIAKPSFINTTDNTNEGLSYINKNIETVQFHPEACPGPQDTEFLFDNFINTVKEVKNAKK